MKLQRAKEIIDRKSSIPIKNESFEDIPSDKGYYTWWFTKDKTEYLLSKINRELNEVDRIDFSKLKKHPEIDYYALYFGVACGAAGLKQRIKWHTAKINGHTKNNVVRGTLSTLRQTICGLNEWDMVVSSDNVDDFLSSEETANARLLREGYYR